MEKTNNLSSLRNLIDESEAKSRALMAQYVANRKRSYEAYAHLDPDSQFTKNAKELFEKATRDLEEFEARLASLHEEQG